MEHKVTRFRREECIKCCYQFGVYVVCSVGGTQILEILEEQKGWMVTQINEKIGFFFSSCFDVSLSLFLRHNFTGKLLVTSR